MLVVPISAATRTSSLLAVRPASIQPALCLPTRRSFSAPTAPAQPSPRLHIDKDILIQQLRAASLPVSHIEVETQDIISTMQEVFQDLVLIGTDRFINFPKQSDRLKLQLSYRAVDQTMHLFLKTFPVSNVGFTKDFSPAHYIIFSPNHLPIVSKAARLRIKKGATADSIARFNHDLAMLKSFNSPSICKVLAVGNYIGKNGVNKSVAYMELYDSNLDIFCTERLSTNPAIRNPMLIDLLKKSLNGLKVVHDRGLMHCDIKGQNFLIKSSVHGEIQVALSDFEMAENCSQPPEVRLGGTPNFFAPENLNHSLRYDKQDIWALAVNFHYFYYRKFPYWNTAMWTTALILWNIENLPASISTSSSAASAPLQEIDAAAQAAFRTQTSALAQKADALALKLNSPDSSLFPNSTSYDSLNAAIEGFRLEQESYFKDEKRMIKLASMRDAISPLETSLRNLSTALSQQMQKIWDIYPNIDPRTHPHSTIIGDLIWLMLDPDPTRRITADNALQMIEAHERAARTAAVPPRVLQNISSSSGNSMSKSPERKAAPVRPPKRKLSSAQKENENNIFTPETQENKNDRAAHMPSGMHVNHSSASGDRENTESPADIIPETQLQHNPSPLRKRARHGEKTSPPPAAAATAVRPPQTSMLQILALR